MEDTRNVPPILIKIGQKHHLENLQKNGELYFGTFEGYRKQELKEKQAFVEAYLSGKNVDPTLIDNFRRDSLEGLENSNPVTAVITKIGDLDLESPIHLENARFNTFQERFIHLYCLYSIRSRINRNFSIDRRNLRFGDHAIIIFDTKTFLERVLSEFSGDIDMNFVDYYDIEVESRNLSPFRKRTLFGYQNEFRIAANMNETNILQIGSISDISVLIKSAELMNIEYRFKDDARRY